jgi:C4-dicarboxylate-specific signal transduction histidine kinase
MSAASSPARESAVTAPLSKGPSPLAHLLHALNQPLTGLQCSLELALTGLRTPEQNLRSLREGLELTGRMRVLVEAIRELVDCEQEEMAERTVVGLGPLLQETVEDLRPLAEAKDTRLLLKGEAVLPVRASRGQLAAVVFRFLDAVLSLAERRSVVRILARAEPANAWLEVSWSECRQAPEHSPFSRQELGLMLALAGWKRAGAECTNHREEYRQTLTIRFPLASSAEQP